MSERPTATDRPLAVTIGEPSGIGPDITLAAYSHRRTLELPPFLVLADPEMLARRAERLGLDVDIQTIGEAREAAAAFERAIPVLPLVNRHSEAPGTIDPSNAFATIEAIDRATKLAQLGEVSAVVTNPIDKKALYDAGFRHPGHTEYLAFLCRDEAGREPRPVMLLTGPELSCVPVTIHIALAEVAAVLTSDLIVETGRIVAQDLERRFGLERPRLAFSGLNPHAGERGAMGREEIEIIAPAIARLVEEGIAATGPLPADTMFHPEARRAYDVALCMYHDQALIPAKALAFDETVNVTLGLPIIRTSPDHGTAASLAGSGAARADSLIAALRLAARLGAISAAPRRNASYAA